MKKNIPGLEPILYKKTEIACVYRSTIQVSGLLFLTQQDNPLQIGIHHRIKPIVLPTHIHMVPKPFRINQLQELLYIVSGKIRVTLFSEANTFIAKKILSAGDSILLKSQAHKIEFLKNARVFEIKQGPYPGDAHAKHYLT